MSADRIGLLYLAAQNLRRRPARSAVSVLGVVLATATLFAVLLGLFGARRSATIGLERLGADLLVVPAEHRHETQEALLMGAPTSFYMDGSLEERVRAIPGVKQASGQIFIETLESAACCTGRVFVVAFDPQTDFTILPWLSTALKRPLRDDEVVVGRFILPLVGEKVKYYGREFTIAGKLYRTGTGIDETVFMTRQAAHEMAEVSKTRATRPLDIPPGAVSAILVRLQPDADPAAVAAAIEKLAPGLSVIARDEVSRTVAEGYARAVEWVLIAAGAALLTSLLMVAVLFMAIVTERRRELGLLRAMGASRHSVLSLILAEAVLLSLTGGAVGVAVGAGAFILYEDLIRQTLQIPYIWPAVWQLALLVAGSLLAAALVGLVAAGYPAARAATLEPYAAIRTGE
ncbi:ABC transporter permease [Caldinitratiruptor microaerophilus]|uniref:Putative hemin transport system permease protein HrtB n=1 Tax=Caldinitratiruptor microaerophilus TaxID=671077 RepID=A0AA35G9C8_9FIRM|nr:ABC transporter permease [Caldinitratiruptor microaerophilus]BDG61323.1 ABC transporter permease [Caldinitratiruptor microaerophilus]